VYASQQTYHSSGLRVTIQLPGDSSSPSVASSFLRRIQSSTKRSKLFKLSRCLLLADGSLSPCQSTSSKYCCISCRCFCDSPLHYRNLHLNSLLAVRRYTYPSLYYKWYHHEYFLSITLLDCWQIGNTFESSLS